jgi:DNA damage-binding protein 1
LFFILQGESQDLLFLVTERYQYFILGWDKDSHQMVTKANGNIKDRIGRPTDSGHKGLVDPENRLFGLHLYDGLFKVIPIDVNGAANSSAFNIKLQELQVLDIIFLHSCSKPTICVLYKDTDDRCHVKTYEVQMKDKEFTDGPWSVQRIEHTSHMLIPVPAPFGGVLIVAEPNITYHNGTNVKQIAMNQTMMVTYDQVGPDPSRFLLADECGTLHVVVLSHEQEAAAMETGTQAEVTGLNMEVLGSTSIASTVSYLDNGVAFIGSSFGDSQLQKMGTNEDNGSELQLLDSFVNLGPVVDFCVMDLDRQGQGQVVTCSGADKDGSLRVIRNGVGINEQAFIELAGIKGMWSLRPSFDSAFDKFLVQSFIDEIRILALEGEEMEELEIPGFEDTRTLYCGNIFVGDNIVQVTSTGVRLVSCSSLELVHSWAVPEGSKITVASGTPTQLLVALAGGSLVYLEVVGAEVKEVAKVQLEHEIACVDLTPLEGAADEAMVDVEGGVSSSGSSSGSALRSSLCCVGMWTDICVVVLSLPSLAQLSREELGGEILPRSVLFATFESEHYLLVALGDGILYTFNFDSSDGSLSHRKKVSLGTQQVQLTPFRSHGPAQTAATSIAAAPPAPPGSSAAPVVQQQQSQSHVFAASDRPAVLYSNNRKLLFSNVNVKGKNLMCPFHSEAFPDCLALASEEDLTIGTIDDIQKLHIRTVPLREQPRRICQHESSHTLVVCTVSKDRDSNEEKNWVCLFDDQTFEELDRKEMDAVEHCCSVIDCVFAGDTTNQQLIAVGTAYAHEDEPEPVSGRVLVYEVTGEGSDRKLTLSVEHSTRGAVYTLCAFNGLILAGVNSKVHVLRRTTRVSVRAVCSGAVRRVHMARVAMLFVELFV